MEEIKHNVYVELKEIDGNDIKCVDLQLEIKTMVFENGEIIKIHEPKIYGCTMEKVENFNDNLEMIQASIGSIINRMMLEKVITINL